MRSFFVPIFNIKIFLAVTWAFDKRWGSGFKKCMNTDNLQPLSIQKFTQKSGFLNAIDEIGQNIEQKIEEKENQKKGNGEKVMLIIRDGWGSGPENEKNAINNAKTPFHDYLVKNCPTVMLKTDSESVGLPSETMGNSEVGHSTIGMGRVLYQPLVRINNAIQNGEFFENETLKKAVEICLNT